MGIWIDTDMGFDDIAAIMVVDASGIMIDGVSLVFGNATLAEVCHNAAGAVAAFGWTCPIHQGRAQPVFGMLETAQSILGDSGIPTVGLSLPQTVEELGKSSSFLALCDWLCDGAGEKRILALGPLTNIAALCVARPDLALKISDLTWMGGGVTSGNHTASAEFNAFADPEALAIVLSHGLPLRMVDLDACRKVTASPADVLPIRNAGGKNAALIADLLEGFIGIATSRGRAAMALYDPVAAVAFCSDLVGWRHARIDVETAGALTRGRTVVESRTGKTGAFNAHFAETVEADAVKETILEALRKEAAR